jgi:hypothetical protein
MAYFHRQLYGPEAYVHEHVVVLPDENVARGYESERAANVRDFAQRMPVFCYWCGHPPQLPLTGATILPFAEQSVALGSWRGTIGSSGARLQGAPKDATLPDSMFVVGAVLRSGPRVAYLTFFGKAGEDLNSTVAEKGALVRNVLEEMLKQSR